MQPKRSLQITLPDELAEMVAMKVASGEYASESDVIRDGLLSLVSRDASLERWLNDDVAPAYDRYKADSAKAVSLEDAMHHLKSRIADHGTKSR
ncbi:ribbon-helix-helix domain-containing protein [Allorhizobium pseudoryzae]|uniref:ribbon-helix-helix domain-containing protein n=1 Tax=Allorhizobium pseudoryzae TaxID=379684 RepID=UPI003D083E08